VEWPSTRASAAGTLLRFFQTISENTSFWQLKRLVTLSTYRSYTNSCIYLSIYLFFSVYELHITIQLLLMWRTVYYLPHKHSVGRCKAHFLWQNAQWPLVTNEVIEPRQNPGCRLVGSSIGDEFITWSEGSCQSHCYWLVMNSKQYWSINQLSRGLATHSA